MRIPVGTLLQQLSWLLPCALAACGDLEVRHVPPPEVVPAGLEGEWEGNWVSAETGATGDVALRVQEFEGEPVIEVVIDHPGVVPGAYELVVTGDAISLRVDDEVVFEARVSDSAQQVLDGRFDWGGDQGTWSATWQRALPEPIDLGGTWQGVLQAVGLPAVPFTMALDQYADGGRLGLSGVVALPPEVWSTPLPMSGFVAFDESGFQFVLQTEQGFAPNVVLSGRGDREPVRVPLGLLQVLVPDLPFSQALVQMVRVP